MVEKPVGLRVPTSAPSNPIRASLARYPDSFVPKPARLIKHLLHTINRMKIPVNERADKVVGPGILGKIECIVIGRKVVTRQSYGMAPEIQGLIWKGTLWICGRISPHFAKLPFPAHLFSSVGGREAAPRGSLGRRFVCEVTHNSQHKGGICHAYPGQRTDD